MKYSFSTILLLVILIIFSCKKDNNEPSNPFGIDYSLYESADQANGYITYQNYGGSAIDLAIDSAYLLQLKEEGFYQLCYFFTGHDSLKVTLKKYTIDLNYHSDAEQEQNMIITSVFNIDTLEMASSALELQPRTETDDFHTVLNLHTSDSKGTFNGTVDGVVLIKE